MAEFDPNDFEPVEVKKPTLQEYLTGAAKIPPGIKGLQSPEAQDFQNQLGHEAVNAIGGSFFPEKALNPVGNALGWAAGKTGLNKLPDWLMQKAVGMKKFIPGVGDKLIDQRVMGPKMLMKGQISNALDKTGKSIGRAVDEIPDAISSDAAAKSVGRLKDNFTTSSGYSPASAKPNLDIIDARAKDIAARPPMPAKEAFELKQIAQGEGYNPLGDPYAKIRGKTAQAEASGYSKTLSDAHANAMKFDTPQPLSELNSTFSALKQGEKAINKNSPSFDLAQLIGKTLPMSTIESVGAHALDQTGELAKQGFNRFLQFKGARPGSAAQPAQFDPNDFEEIK